MMGRNLVWDPVPRPQPVIPKDDRITSNLASPEYLSKVYGLHAAIERELPLYDVDKLTSHHFCEGLYCRQFDLPAGGVAVGKMHGEESFFLLMKGRASFSTEDGMVTVEAPFMTTTTPGSKRVVYAHTDCTWLTFHPNPENHREIPKLEQRIIIPDPQPSLEGPTHKQLEKQI
jgi:hypothetical protein